MRKTALPLLCLWAVISLGAQTVLGPDSTGLDPEKSSGGTLILEKVDFIIHGYTAEYSLRAYMDIQEGRLFSSLDELAAYIAAKDRYLKDNAIFLLESAVTFDIIGEGDPAPVRVRVEAFDHRARLALPFLKFSNEKGLSLALRYKDANFLGTLYPLTLNADHYFEEGQTVAGAAFQVDPIALGSRWALRFEGAARFGAAKGLEADLFSASLASNYPLRGALAGWTLTPGMSYLYKAEETIPTLDLSLAASRQFGFSGNWAFRASTTYRGQWNGGYSHSILNDARLSVAIPLAQLPNSSIVVLTPALTASLDMASSAGYEPASSVGLSSSLGYEALEWRGSFRQGSSASFTMSYLRHRGASAPEMERDLAASLFARAAASWGDLLGIDLRLTGRWDIAWTMWGNSSDSKAFDWGPLIRGIPTARYGDLGLLMNAGFPLNFAQGAFFKSKKLEAEVFLNPFVDAGILRSDPACPIDMASDAILCGGMEAIIFPKYSRTFIYRLSLGYDLLDLAKTGIPDLAKLEGWLGFGLHF